MARIVPFNSQSNDLARVISDCFNQFGFIVRELEVGRDYSSDSIIISVGFVPLDDRYTPPIDPHADYGLKFKISSEQTTGSKISFEQTVLVHSEIALKEFIVRHVGPFYGEKTMPKAQQKPTIVRQKPIATDKLRGKPQCPIDKVHMVFDPAAQKFRCPIETCNQVARPKRDSDDKQLVLGQGQLQARFIMQPAKEARVVLVSDDNVALDITTLVAPSVRYKMSQHFAEKYLAGTTSRVEKVVPIPINQLAGLKFDEVLLMFEP